MKQQINETKRMQQLAGILTEAPNKAFDQTALDHSNSTPNTPPGATPGKTPTDVSNLTKMIQSNTSLVSKLKTINNAEEITAFLTFIINNINPKVLSVNKMQLKAIIDKRFK